MRELKFREIKFRAFDTENKTWTFVTLGDLVCGACTEKGDKPLSGAKQVWEQYTGIKDKNGKEIYEGDIVQESNCKTVVEFSTEDVGSCGCCVDRFWGSGFIVTISDNPEDCEVIGNIHENKELSE